MGLLVGALKRESFTGVKHVGQDQYVLQRWCTGDGASRTTSLLRMAILHGLWAFVRIYVLYAEYHDGRERIMLALFNAEGEYLKSLKV